jgi:hypothetical protein
MTIAERFLMVDFCWGFKKWDWWEREFADANENEAMTMLNERCMCATKVFF